MIQKTEQLSRTNPHVYVYICPLIISVKRDSAYDKKEKAQGFTFHLYYPSVFCA